MLSFTMLRKKKESDKMPAYCNKIESVRAKREREAVHGTEKGEGNT